MITKDDFLKSLKKIFLVAFCDSLALSALLYLVFWSWEPLLSSDPRTNAYVMIVVLALVFIAVGGSSFFLRHRANKCNDLPQSELDAIATLYTPAYKLRVVSLGASMVLSAVCFALTHEGNSSYLVAILALLMLLSFPSEQYVFRR